MAELDVQMPTVVAGLHFRNPFLVGSGPSSRTLEQLIEAERCGWAAAAIKLTIDPPAYINRPPRYHWSAKGQMHMFTAERRLTMDEGLRLVEQARARTRELILLANMAYTGDGLDGWARMASRFRDAGAHAIELNLCCPNMSFNLDVSGREPTGRPSSGASVGQDPEAVAAIVAAVREAVDLPIFAKLTPEGGRLGLVARRAFEAGADCLASTANRVGVPEIDIHQPFKPVYRLQDAHSISCLSGPWIKPLGLRDVYEMRVACGPGRPLVGYGGVRTYADAVQYAMLGADLIGICTETMLRGFGFLGDLIARLRQYMSQMGFGRWSDLHNLLASRFASADELVLAPGYAVVDQTICKACGRCVQIGHCYAIEGGRGRKAVVLAGRCEACGTCVDLCPSGAIRIVEASD
ncbi:MAG: 4Fe-4S binding protein [Phycisphaerae bacterium]